MEYDEAADIQRAIDGDVGARMRVEIIQPWANIVKDRRIDHMFCCHTIHTVSSVVALMCVKLQLTSSPVSEEAFKSYMGMITQAAWLKIKEKQK